MSDYQRAYVLISLSISLILIGASILYSVIMSTSLTC